jgi:hypothetical protein
MSQKYDTSRLKCSSVRIILLLLLFTACSQPQSQSQVCLHLAAVLRRELEAEQTREAACMTSDATSAVTLAAVALQQRAAAADSIMNLLSQYRIVGGSELAAYLAHSEAVMVQCGLAKRARMRKGGGDSSVSGSDCGTSFCSGKRSILLANGKAAQYSYNSCNHLLRCATDSMLSGANSAVTGTSFNTHIAPGEEENADSPYMHNDTRPATDRYPAKPSNTTTVTTTSSATTKAAAAVSTPAALAAGFARAQHSVRAGDSSDTVALPTLIPLPAALTGTSYTNTVTSTVQYSACLAEHRLAACNRNIAIHFNSTLQILPTAT